MLYILWWVSLMDEADMIQAREQAREAMHRKMTGNIDEPKTPAPSTKTKGRIKTNEHKM